jgi:hypothetical protein
MKKNAKADRRTPLNLSMRVVVALVLTGLLVVPVAVQADLKATAVVYAWDIVANKFQNSNVIIPWDGTWIPFLHELNFDTDLWSTPQGCSAGETTRWAGNMFYGLYHVDDAPLGAPGFQETRKWSLISCDRTGDGSFNNADLTAPPSPYDRPLVYAECDSAGTYCYVDEATNKDVQTSCTTGNCQYEIVTTIEVNLDQDCDGVVDPVFPTDPRTGEPEMLCFFAEARTPTFAEQVDQDGNPLPVWSNPLQARISTVGGDKTVNFAVEQPTTVDLAAFGAAPQCNGVVLTWETASELDNLGFNIYRAESRAGQLVKINQGLVASQDPGSTVGAAYAFLDESAAPGTTYYYWLEDIDASGTATKHGPVAAKRAAAKALPGRPRPAPMPGNAF